MRLGNRKCAGDIGPISLVANASSRTVSQAGVASGSTGASTATRACSFTVSVSCGSAISIQVKTLPKKSLLSRRRTGSGTICSEATCTRSPSRDTGVSRSTWRACATGDA